MIHQLLHDNHPPLDYTVLWLVAHTVGIHPDRPATAFDRSLARLTIPMLYLAGRALVPRVGRRPGCRLRGGRAPGHLVLPRSAHVRAVHAAGHRDDLGPGPESWPTASASTGWPGAGAGAAMIWTQWFSTLAVGTEILILAWVLLARCTSAGAHLIRLAVAARRRWRSSVRPGVPLLFTQFHNNQVNGLGFGSHGPANTTGSFSPYGFLNNSCGRSGATTPTASSPPLVAIWPLGILGVLLLLGRGRSRSNLRIARDHLSCPWPSSFGAGSNCRSRPEPV